MSRADPDPGARALRGALGGFFGSVLAVGGGFTAIALGGTAISGAAVERQRRRRNTKCDSCAGERFVRCATCLGKRAIDWQPIERPSVDRVCLCPTCQGSGLQKCLNCLGQGVVLPMSPTKGVCIKRLGLGREEMSHLLLYRGKRHGVLCSIVQATEIVLGFVGPRAPATNALVALPLLLLGQSQGVGVANA